MAFVAAEVEKMPRLVCTGQITEVTKAKLTEKKVYYLIGFKIEGTRGSRGTYTNLLFRPEWFDPTFNPKSLLQVADAEMAKKLHKQFARSIANRGTSPSSMSTLQGILGGKPETLAEFGQAVEEYVTANLGGKSFADVPDGAAHIRTVLVQFINGNVGELGYVLKQKTEKVGETEDGKGVYELTDGYEVGNFYDVEDEKYLKSQFKSAEKDPSKVKIGFEH